MSDAANNSAMQRRRSAMAIYAALTAVMAVTAVVSLWISAPAWLPGAPGLHQPERWDELASNTRQLQQRQRQRLERYEWQDRDAQKVAIPIQRAMELIVSDAAAGQEATP